MERWEVIERRVLIGVAVALLGASAWLLFSRVGVERLLAAVPLPFAFWALWQAFFEDRLLDDVAPSRAERIFAATWRCSRLLLIGGIAALFASLAVRAALGATSFHDFLIVCVFAFLAFMAGSTALFGGGIARSMVDDLEVHRQRKARYGWWS